MARIDRSARIKLEIVQEASRQFLTNGYMGSHYQTEGFRIELIIRVVDPSGSTKRVCDYGRCITYTVAAYTDNYTSAGWDVPVWYLIPLQPSISIIDVERHT